MGLFDEKQIEKTSSVFDFEQKTMKKSVLIFSQFWIVFNPECHLPRNYQRDNRRRPQQRRGNINEIAQAFLSGDLRDF